MPGKALDQPARFVRRKGLIKRCRFVRIEIVLDECDFFNIGKVDVAQVAQEVGIIDACAPVRDRHQTAAFQWREGHEQVGDAGTLVFIVEARRLAGLHGDRRTRFLDELLRCLIQANQRLPGIMRARIDVEYILHRSNKSGVFLGRDHPVLAAVRLEFIFFKVRPTVL